MLVGRSVETAAIDRLLAAAREGRSGVLVVRGEAGIGKTALLDYARGQADGMTVLRGVGIETESELAFGALHQLLRQVLDRIDHLPGPQASALRAAFALSDERVDERFRISVGVLGLLAEVAEERPLLCVIDDAQWLDDASAAALLFTARRIEAERIVMLFAAREDDERSFDAPGLPSLLVPGLDQAAARALLEERVGDGLAASVRERLVEHTGGNALALLELPPTLTEAQLSGNEPLPDPMPIGLGLQGAYLSRVRCLPDATASILLVAAAEDSGELAAILRAARSIGIGHEALEPAERDGLVSVLGGHVVFRHPLIRSAVYQGATFGERRAVHAALAEAQDESNRDRCAWHRAAAAEGPDEEIAKDLEASAQRAARRGAYAAAASAHERAAGLSSQVQGRTLRLLAAADAAWLAGRADRARGLLADAGRLAPAELRVDVTKLLGRIEVRSGVFADATEMLLSAAQELARSDPATALRLLVEAEEATLYTGDNESVVQIGILAEQIADAKADGVDHASARVLTGIGLQMSGRFEEAMPLLHEALDVGATSEDVDRIIHAGRVASGLGDDIAAADLNKRALRIAREHGAVGALPRILERLVFNEFRLGRYSSARVHAVEGLRLAREMGQEPGICLCELAIVAAIQGREDECRACAAEAMERAFERRSGLLASMATWGLGLLELGLGRPEEAMAAFEPALAEDALTHTIIALFLTPDYIEAAARAGRLDAAHAKLGPFEEWAHAVGQPWALALVSHCRGLVTTGEAAEEHLAEALELHPQSIRPFEHARTELALGETLRRQRKRREAREHLRSALQALEGLGAVPWEERARTELRATGETARKRDPSTLDALTPQELQIARLVGEGGSNKDIAAQLFLSPRTVEYHLRKVFAKLGIASRAELVKHSARLDPERALVHA